MKKLTLFLVGLISACSTNNLFNTPLNEALLTVAEEPVMMDEFIYAFNKNRPADSLVSQADIDEYLDLYINFKLKVTEAKARGMDTTSEFKQEYNSYISQLDNSYLQTDSETDALVKEAYDRMQYELKAAHILFAVNAADSPEDTLAAYQKAIMVRDSILGGASFEIMAKTLSDDPSAKQNGGDLGYFSVFQMVYPFETAAYSTAVGNISLPVRTKFGYHLIKIEDKRPNEGKVKVAHIMIRKQEGDRDIIFAIYDQLLAGADWDQTCQQNSEDAQSAARGGTLAPFSRNQIVPEFAEAAFSLTKPGELSDPVQTAFGWHIIKMIERVPIGDFESNKQRLLSQVRRDSRAQISKQKMVARLLQENDLQEYTDNVQVIIKPENHIYLKDKWLFEDDTLASLPLFEIKEEIYSAKDFYAFVNKSTQHGDTKNYLYEQYNTFKEESVINYEKAHLSEKYPDYRYLRQEYYDGILLFSIMENEVWARASKDSLGLAEYYQQNISNYVDTTKLAVAIFSSDNRQVLDSVLIDVPGANALNKLTTEEKEVLLNQYNDLSQLSLQLDSGEYVIDKHPVLKNLTLPYTETILKVENRWYYVIPMRNYKEAIPMADIRGKVIADYQLTLEDRWISKLKSKYSVNINSSVLKKVYKQLENL
jgi:peptidyl-prolyl cis-trans isomerase SurA